MFNLAQRQLRISLWGTEPANRSTCKESKQEKEALFGAMATGLGCELSRTFASARCFCQEDRWSLQFTLRSVTLHLFNASVKQPRRVIPPAHTFC